MLAVIAPPAMAQDDDVIVDPGSPSGKEYALPVDSARKQASKDAKNSSSKAQPAPLFGEGVGDDAATSTSASAPSGSGGSGGDGADGTRSTADGSRAPDAPRAGPGTATLKSQAAAPGGGIGLVAIIGAGLGVLALGAAIGLLLRRRAARAASAS